MPHTPLGLSFAPTFDGAAQAKATTPPQQPVQTLSFRLPATQGRNAISPLVRQDGTGGVNSAVLEAALRHVFGPGGIDGFLQQAQAPSRAPTGGPAFEGALDTPTPSLPPSVGGGRTSPLRQYNPPSPQDGGSGSYYTALAGLSGTPSIHVGNETAPPLSGAPRQEWA